MRLTVLALLLVALFGCATTRLPMVAVVVVTFDEEGAIATVASEDLRASDPLLAACAQMVGQLRTSIRGPSAGVGTVSFGCPVESLAARNH
jgi:hypothetical protein